MKPSRSSASILVFFLLILLIFGLGWASYNFSTNNIAGEGFIIQWIGIRSLATTGTSPYSASVSADIQKVVLKENSFAPGNPVRYTAPLFSGLVVFPFGLIADRNIAHALWLSVQLGAIFAILLLSEKIAVWKPTWYIFLLFSLFSIFSYHVIIPWLDGGLPIWAALFLVLAFLAINDNRNELAGISLALSAIQPQMVLLVLVFTIIWAISQRRKLLILWFTITLVFLSAVGLFLVPDWIAQYIRLLYNFGQNFPPGTPGVLFKETLPGVGKQLGWLISGVCGLILLAEWLLARNKNFRWFIWTACLTLVISQWIGIPTIPGNFIGLILPLVLISAMFMERSPKAGQWVAVLFAVIAFIWEWAVYYLDLTSHQPAMQLNLLIPLPLILLIGLYWVRWWVIKPRRMLIEELKLNESD